MRFLLGTIIGVVLGAVTALLFRGQSGAALRRRLAARQPASRSGPGS